ncbi:MAG: DUF1853 family protein [Pseudomonadaceae bacterium]|nr:MAG: DUF1853 family protein [Pseudomonadaceae bacterium]
MPTTHLPAPEHFCHPALRHLVWMLGAPQLLSDAHSFSLVESLTPAVLARLQALAEQPQQLPSRLTEAVKPRLGLYFEDLYEHLLCDLLGWELLGRNLPVREGGRTLGELDFLLRNPHNGAIEHHEIAIKFYLGYPDHGYNLWYGPNANDRLDLKSERLLGHQRSLSSLEATRDMLMGVGLPVPETTRVFMPGYLFYPAEVSLKAPQQVADNHLRGYWHRDAQLQPAATQTWVPLKKPHWLGPWQQTIEPDPKAVAAELKAVAEHHSPRLFARMTLEASTGIWHETSRHFVVPSTWPLTTIAG